MKSETWRHGDGETGGRFHLPLSLSARLVVFFFAVTLFALALDFSAGAQTGNRLREMEESLKPRPRRALYAMAQALLR